MRLVIGLLLILMTALPQRAGAAPSFSVRVRLDPNPLPARDVGIIKIATEPGASCHAIIHHPNGSQRVIIGLYATLFDGIAVWIFTPRADESSGTIEARCWGEDNIDHKALVSYKVAGSVPVFHGKLAAQVTIVPNSIVNGGRATVWVHTQPRATCDGGIQYNDGTGSQTFDAYTQHVGPNGMIIWPWQVSAANETGGTVKIRCYLAGQAAYGTATFAVAGG